LLNILLSREAFNKELSIVKFIAQQNLFPSRIINKMYFKYVTKFKMTFNTIRAEKPATVYRSLTYFGNISSHLARIFAPLNITCSFKTINTLKRHLVKVKDKVCPLLSYGVYEIKCTECPAVYVGQSKT